MLDTEQMDVAESQCERSLRVDVWRGGKDGAFSTYSVPWRENQTVLDVVTEIQRHHEPALAYRFACRVGVCGSCAMTVNGVPRWTCRTHVRRVAGNGHITIEPLRNMPVIKDLACDMSEFFDKWQGAGGRFEGKATRKDAPMAVDPASKKRRNADRGIECINCGICSRLATWCHGMMNTSAPPRSTAPGRW